jgi:hypothetical protein
MDEAKEYVIKVNVNGKLADECLSVLQAKELVRCKDCVHWDKGCTEECNNTDSVCFHNGRCKPDWFCADGERRNTDV